MTYIIMLRDSLNLFTHLVTNITLNTNDNSKNVHSIIFSSSLLVLLWWYGIFL